MSSKRRVRRGLALIIIIVGAIIDIARPCIAGAYCTGECDGDGVVGSGEAVYCRGIAFGSLPRSQCPECDCDENGVVSDAEWMRAQDNVLNGCNTSECPAATATGAPVTRTPTPTPGVPTPSRTPTVPQPTATTNPSGTPSTSVTPTVIAGACVGDCDASGRVLVNELVIGVNIVLEQVAVETCVSFDGNQSGSVSVDELVRGVNNLIRGCTGAP